MILVIIGILINKVSMAELVRCQAAERKIVGSNPAGGYVDSF